MSATNQERFLLDEADQAPEVLIAAAREVVAAWRDDPDGKALSQWTMRVHRAIDRLEELVGRP